MALGGESEKGQGVCGRGSCVQILPSEQPCNHGQVTVQLSIFISNLPSCHKIQMERRMVKVLGMIPLSNLASLQVCEEHNNKTRTEDGTDPLGEI